MNLKERVDEIKTKRAELYEEEVELIDDLKDYVLGQFKDRSDILQWFVHSYGGASITIATLDFWNDDNRFALDYIRSHTIEIDGYNGVIYDAFQITLPSYSQLVIFGDEYDMNIDGLEETSMLMQYAEEVARLSNEIKEIENEHLQAKGI